MSVNDKKKLPKQEGSLCIPTDGIRFLFVNNLFYEIELSPFQRVFIALQFMLGQP
jgi:hypothetical protein